MDHLRILVPGGAGYVGSHVVAALLEQGHEPVVYDNLSSGHEWAVRDAELVVGDVTDRERLMATLRRSKYDGVIHLAAVSLVGESMKDPSRYFYNNVVGGLSLFDSLVATGVPWVVFSSTAAVYGTPESVPITESHPTRPASPYGESKLMLEQILKWYEVAHGLRSVAFRYFNAAGAHGNGQLGEAHDPETHLVPIIIQAALGQRNHLEIFGTDYPTADGTAVRDYVHVCDLADAHLAAMEYLHAGGASDCYNLGSEAGYSVLQVIDAVERITGQAVPVHLGSRRAGDPPVLVADAEKVRQRLGWRPKHDLSAIVRSALAWHRNYKPGLTAGTR